MDTMKEAIEKGRVRYLKNKYWKSIYDGAPECAKGWYDLIFSQQDGGRAPGNIEAFSSMMDRVYSSLDDAGWNYIIEHTTHNMMRNSLREKRAKYGKGK